MEMKRRFLILGIVLVGTALGLWWRYSAAPTHAAVIFDKGSHTFRNDIYDLYKANRDAMPLL